MYMKTNMFPFNELLQNLIGWNREGSTEYAGKELPVSLVVGEKNINRFYDYDYLSEYLYKYATKHDYVQMISTIEYKKNGYGFSDRGNIFCHVKAFKTTNSSRNFEELCKQDTLFLIKSQDTDRGSKAVEIKMLDEISQEDADEIRISFVEYLKQAFWEDAIGDARNKYYLEEQEKKAARIREIFGGNVTCYNEDRGYGSYGLYRYIIESDSELTYQQVVEAIKLIKGEHAMDLPERSMGYTEPRNIISTYNHCPFDTTEAKSRKWYWLHDVGTCD